jgi:L-arabinokinase
VPAVFFYISGHGFGHSIRQIEILNALRTMAPADLDLFVRTSAAPWLFSRSARGPFVLLPGETDTGVSQIDSLRLDERATIELASAFHADLPRRVEAEAALLDRHEARLVIADAPPLACAAAHAAGIPSVVCANFTWDWIYQEYEQASPAAGQLVARVQEAYAHAAAGWRLPMHGGFETVAAVEDVPLVARRSSPDRTVEEIRAELGLPRDLRLALVSFGGYGVRDLPLAHLDCTGTWRVVVTTRGGAAGPLPPGVVGVPELAIHERGLRYQDLVRSVDVVISKPGYGIISDCVANGAALLYTSRGRFAEYTVLVREMPRFLRCRFISMDDLLMGRWQDGLDALAAAPPPPDAPRTDGAEVVAAMILERLAA